MRAHHEAWLDYTRDWEDSAPDVVHLWKKTQVARNAYLCDHCGEEIAPGTKYESEGYRLDGEFHHHRLHIYAYGPVSGCPKFRERDLALVRKDFEAENIV